MFLATDQLRLEPQVAGHAAEMFAVLSDPAIYEFENGPPESEAWLRERFSRLESRRSEDGAEQWLNWVIRLPDGELAGYVQATVTERGVAQIAYELASKHWRRGIGSGAVRLMQEELMACYGVTTFVAVLKARNFRSVALLRSLGFLQGSPGQAAEFGAGPDEWVFIASAKPRMHKLSCLVDGEWAEHAQPLLFEVEPAGETQRLRAGLPSGSHEPFERLALCLAPPYMLLYILHTPRGEASPGRYQSPEISAEEFRSFMAKFGGYLSSDARFDLWLHSPAERATVVWDRHNQLFAYGPLERFAAALRSLGYDDGKCAALGAHQHHYRPDCDAEASELLSWCAWQHSPLRPEDEQ